MSEYSNNKTFQVSENLVPYEIPKNYNNKLMFLAEAPGAEEDKAGKPLVGVSGKKFNGWLEETGINRDECIVGNTFRFRPHDNKVERFFVTDKLAKEQNIEKAPPPLLKYNSKSLMLYFQRELDYLYYVIARHKPKVLVTMGGIALWATLNQTRITLHHGIAIKHNFSGQKDGKGKSFSHLCTVIPVFHPAACIENRDVDGSRNKAVLEAFSLASKKAEE